MIQSSSSSEFRTVILSFNETNWLNLCQHIYHHRQQIQWPYKIQCTRGVAGRSRHRSPLWGAGSPLVLCLVCLCTCSLGAYHDGQSNDCSSKDQYVMAKSPAELSENNFLHPYQFSRCSVTYFRAYLNKLNTYCHTYNFRLYTRTRPYNLGRAYTINMQSETAISTPIHSSS